MQQEEDKLRDKPTVDLRRAYLDAETSDEDQTPIKSDKEIERPKETSLRTTYDREELKKLIGFVKNMTALSNLDENYWNDSATVIEDIELFLTNTHIKVLTIFFNNNILTSDFNFTNLNHHAGELAYFIRKKEQAFHADTFYEEIIFGTIDTRNIEATIIALTSEVLAPIFMNIYSWNNTNFGMSLYGFLSSLTEQRYKAGGLTVIYVPIETNNLTVTEACSNKELMDRLEKLIFLWTKQIRLALSESESQIINARFTCIIDEHKFWTTRWTNLRGLNHQIKSAQVQHILSILSQANSGQLEQFVLLNNEIELRTKEAETNIEFLELLKAPCEDLNEITKPEDLLELLPKVLHVFRYIWLNSTFYGERAYHLMKMINNQVINLNRGFVNLDDIFEHKKTREGIEILEKCIGACENYKDLYSKFAQAHSGLTSNAWDLDDKEVFHYVDIFVERCKNLIEICYAMIDFAQLDEKAETIRGIFSGTNGKEYERVCNKIEKRFLVYLQTLRLKAPKILDVEEPTWYDDMFAFQNEMKDLEITIENLVNLVFRDMNNVHQGISNLAGFQIYMNRKSLKTLFDSIITKIWLLFASDIQAVKQELVEERNESPSNTPYFSGRALSLKLKSKRLEATRQRLLETKWAGHCGISCKVCHQQEMLVGSISETIFRLYHEWMDDIGDNPKSRLDRYLMRRSDDKPGLLESNLDPNLVNLCREANYWQNLGFQIPIYVQMIYDKWDTLQFVSESVLMLVRAYNRILDALSPQEKAFFRRHITDLDEKIYPGLCRLTWNSDLIDVYVKKCCDFTTDFQEFLDTYKDVNSAIFQICEKISVTPLVKLQPNFGYSLSEFESEIKNSRDIALKELEEKYRDIIKYLLVVYERFQWIISESTEEWKNYLINLDRIFEESLRLSIRSSLTLMFNALHGVDSNGPSTLILIGINLLGNDLTFQPPLDESAQVISSIFKTLLEPLKSVLRFPEKFSLGRYGVSSLWRTFRENDSLLHFQKLLDKEIEVCFNFIQDYLKTWVPFRDIWEIDKNSFIASFESSNPSPKSFDAEISRYSELVSTLQAQETIAMVHFLYINSDQLKTVITEHCAEWQNKLTRLLLDMTQRTVEEFYASMSENTKIISKEPTDLIEMQATLQLFERLRAEIPWKEEEFPKIREQYQILEKYEVQMTREFKRRVKELEKSWDSYVEFLSNYATTIREIKEQFKCKLLKQADVFKEDTVALLNRFQETGPFTSDWKTHDARTWLADFQQELTRLKQVGDELKRNLTIFEASFVDSEELDKIEREFTAIQLVWELTNKWDESWERYKTVNFWTIETDEMESVATKLFKKFTRLSKELQVKNWPIIESTRSRIDEFRRTLPLIIALKNPAMRERHWDKVKLIIGQDFDESSEEFTLSLIMKLGFQNYSDEISDISTTASMELNIEQGLRSIAAAWSTLKLEMTLNKETGIYRLQSVDEILQTLEDHQVQLSAMKSTRFVEPFVNDVDQWEGTLSRIADLLEVMLLVQKDYIYLDNIFRAEDIRNQMPNETDSFDALTIQFKEIYSQMAAAQNVIQACHDSNTMLRQLNKLTDDMDSIQRALERYLETKRHVFPRFYFISNDDLLEILGNAKRPDFIQKHIKKLFGNIHALKISKMITGRHLAEGMISAEGEYAGFLKAVVMEGPVENWLCKIETGMRECLKEVLRECRSALRKIQDKRDKWVKEWLSQPGITSTQIQWTSDCTRALVHCKAMESRKPLRKLRKRQNQTLAKYSEAIRSDVDKLLRIKLKAIVVIEIHARDVIEKLYKLRCKEVTSFDWLSQLRFYWDRGLDDCVIRQTNTSFIYGYEYLGTSERLVITPLTDRCYITLTTALNLYRGGCPKGPAGTGKTETVKDLGKALGLNVIVQNCSEGLDYKSMGRLFAGLAQTGAWGCFDEFNRINIEVLSVVAQQILSILTALAQKLTRFIFEGKDISLVRTTGIFITMNPGYAGRTELPDNLKSMFRPISMMVPDSAIIAEINLFGEGFEDTRILARKVFTLYALAQQQLSKQPHYDFGLRGIVTLTRYAGKKRRQYSHLPDEEIIILSMNDMNKSKLTSDDLPLFTNITTDLFPEIKVPKVDYDEFIEYITKEAIGLNLQPIPMLLTKVIELFETKNSRHSTMIVGESNTGKSTTWKILKKTLTSMSQDGKKGFNIVSDFPINPKALNLGELYGEYNPSTGEWSDGVISSIMRTTCTDNSPDEKWIIFDGPVDALWIENMNSVMDDNKILTLINNERITMSEQVSLLFEVQDLAVASPATVSRAGMIYNDYKDLGWRPAVNSWLESYKTKQEEFVQEMDLLFENYLDKILEFKRTNCKELIAVNELNAVEGLCKLLSALATEENGLIYDGDKDNFSFLCKIWFLFCVIWSVCATVDEEGRRKMDNYIREIENIFPLKDTIYEYYVDVRQRGFTSWEEKLSLAWRYPTEAPFHKIIVPTVDTVRYDYLLNALLTHGCPVLLVGAVGTGKTSMAQSILESLNKSKYSVLTINMSGQTSSNNIQDAVESRLEKRMKGVYLPFGGKTLITFMDDFNMPSKDTYGSQPPLELIRQWIDYKFWYHRKKQIQKFIQKMQLICAMGPPGGGRSTISNRIITKFNVINITLPIEKQTLRIYSTMLNQQLLDFNPEVKGIAKDITLSTIEIYNSVLKIMLPTPGKMHYLFNLRDISKVFQGLLRSHKDYQYSRWTFLRLWVHEIFRVFSDRLIDDRDRDWLISKVNEQLGKYFELTFKDLCPEKRSPVFGAFMNAWNIYEDLQDMDPVRCHIERQMEEYNTSPGVVRLNLVLFGEAVEHICRIARVISQPRGNMLLVGIGGSGRQSLSKIASYITELRVFQVQVTKQYGVPEFREDLKRLYSMTGVDNKPTSFLFHDSQVVEELFLEIVNSMLGTSQVGNLYKPDEIEEIKNSLMKEAMKEGIIPTAESILLFMIERVRANMHIMLCMNPIGEKFRNRLRQYPSLINCTTIDWFLAWPREALLEVGNKFLMNLSFVTTITGVDKPEPRRSTAAAPPIYSLQERMVEGVTATFALIHDTVIQYSRRMEIEMSRYCYVTPGNFLELVVGYKKMLENRRRKVAEQANKLNGGLTKINETKDKVNDMAVELEVTQRQVLKATEDCEEYLLTIVTQKRDADDTQKNVTARSLRIEKESEECKKLESVARADLETVEPALDRAMKALDTLNKKDLAEIKSFARPPPGVEMVLEAVMILKNSEPSWAESKRQLGDVNFLYSLKNFAKDRIADRTLRAIRKYTSSREFNPDKVGQVSIAAKSLCMWVIAMEQYGKLYRIVAPKRERLELALNSLREKEKTYNEAVIQLQKLRSELESLEQMYDAKMKEKEDLIRLANLLKIKLERAAMLVDGLSDEHLRWQETVESLGEFYERLPGDCLISTAFISYLGPFLSNYREELVQIWIKEILTREIPSTSKFDLKQFLSTPTTIREWNIQGLPSDEFSTENGIIITQSTRWPLVIDPQCQAVKWIKNMEATNSLRVIDFATRDFIKVLEQALQFGEPVLLQNIGEHVDPILNPVLHKSFAKIGDAVMIKFNDKMISYNDNFRLYITTKLANPHYSPEISTKTALCNFAIKEQGLETQLLGIAVRKERPQLEEQKDNLVLSIATGKRTLEELEDKILHLLSITSGSLLDDLDLLNTLQTSKSTSTSVEESLVTSLATEEEIDKAREEYRPCSKRATILFFILNELYMIDPMYQFSLDAYISLFIHSIDKCPKKHKISERIEALNDFHTYAVYTNTCRGLFERHKLLFSFHMCTKILQAQGKINPSEYYFLLKGGIVLDREHQPEKPVTWLSSESWDNVTELDKFPGLHGIASSFEERARDWYNWYITTEPESMYLPGGWEESLTEFQKILIIRSCRTDRVIFSVTKFIINNLGSRFVEPPVLDIKGVLDDSTAQSPLIFILSPGVDPTAALMQLAESQGMAQRFMTLSLGQGQAPIATNMIEAGWQDGSWIFLANCHLSLSWMPTLDKIVESLINNGHLHPDFRLWLSSSPTSEFPISILQAGVKMTTEPPRGLKANMKRLYGLITTTQFDVCQAKTKYKKLLFALVFFHSILLERRKFQQLGWNVIYSFNDSDFKVSDNILQVYLDDYQEETPWDALKYLIAGVCYGGHVTDDWDRRLLMTYVDQYLNSEIFTKNSYRLSTSPSYYVPRDGSLESYCDFITMLPSTDNPEVFGQHINAEITSLIIETCSMLETLMSLQIKVSPNEITTSNSSSYSKEDKVMQLAGDIEAMLPQNIDWETAEKLIGSTNKTPLSVVLLQEIARYNILLELTRDSVRDLQAGIKGLIVMSDELEEIFMCVYEGRVPSTWLTAYPSLKPLGSWTRDLISRVQHLAKWAETTRTPLLFWLAAYTFPTAFLTAVLQTSARLLGLSIDSLTWEFNVINTEDPITEPPEDGVYVRSIYLEGAGWNCKAGTLVEPAPLQLICDMPVIHFRPIESTRKKPKDVYNCPCYYYPLRSGTQSHSAFVVAVDLKTGQENPDFWVKRATALLLSLAD